MLDLEGKFRLENILIDGYCNRLYDIKKGSASFYAKAELKQKAQAKILISQILIRKRGHQVVK